MAIAHAGIDDDGGGADGTADIGADGPGAGAGADDVDADGDKAVAGRLAGAGADIMTGPPVAMKNYQQKSR